jgi:hypothetical protein
MFNGFFSKFLTPFTLKDHNFLSSNLFSTILSVLNVPRGRLQVLFEHYKQKTFPWLLYSNTLVACNVQLSWFMKFVMEFFIPYPLASNCIWLSI